MAQTDGLTRAQHLAVELFGECQRWHGAGEFVVRVQGRPIASAADLADVLPSLRGPQLAGLLHKLQAERGRITTERERYIAKVTGR